MFSVKLLLARDTRSDDDGGDHAKARRPRRRLTYPQISVNSYEQDRLVDGRPGAFGAGTRLHRQPAYDLDGSAARARARL